MILWRNIKIFNVYHFDSDPRFPPFLLYVLGGNLGSLLYGDVSVMSADNIHFGIGSCVPPFGKERFTRFTVCSPCYMSTCNLIISQFDFEGRIFVLIVSVPAHCLSFTFEIKCFGYQ